MKHNSRESGFGNVELSTARDIRGSRALCFNFFVAFKITSGQRVDFPKQVNTKHFTLHQNQNHRKLEKLSLCEV